MTTTTTTFTALDVDALREEIRSQIRSINEERGTTAYDDPQRVSFGYLGNVYGNDWSGIAWSVFLPHPHRTGTFDDLHGRVGHDNVAGFASLLAWVILNRAALVEYRG